MMVCVLPWVKQPKAVRAHHGAPAAAVVQVDASTACGNSAGVQMIQAMLLARVTGKLAACTYALTAVKRSRCGLATLSLLLNARSKRMLW